jgi:hypothetical protein
LAFGVRQEQPCSISSVGIVSRANNILRIVAVLGVAAVLLQETVTAFPLHPRQEYGIIVSILAVAGVAVVFRLLMPREAGRLLRHHVLLVPLGLLVFAHAALGWLALLPAFAAVMVPAWPLKLWVLSFSVSVLFVVSVLLEVAYGAWTTTLILDTVHQGRADPDRLVKSQRVCPRCGGFSAEQSLPVRSRDSPRINTDLAHYRRLI